MHVREAGGFGAGFSVVMAGWPKEAPPNVAGGGFGVVKTKGYRTKTPTDYNTGRGTSYSTCTAIADGVFGILLNDKGDAEVAKPAKGETAIFSSSLFYVGCNHADFNLAYGMQFKDWVYDKDAALSEPRYRAFVYMGHFFAYRKEQHILDSEGQTAIYGADIIDHNYKVRSLIAGGTEEPKPRALSGIKTWATYFSHSSPKKPPCY